MVDTLDYKTPKAIAEIIKENSKADSLGSVMDLGCGTGLLEQRYDNSVSDFEGIDLSKKMLSEANKKNIYDELIKDEIISYLEKAKRSFDYFVATDVFVYIGDLSDVFRLPESGNKGGGRLAFS